MIVDAQWGNLIQCYREDGNMIGWMDLRLIVMGNLSRKESFGGTGDLQDLGPLV